MFKDKLTDDLSDRKPNLGTLFARDLTEKSVAGGGESGSSPNGVAVHRPGEELELIEPNGSLDLGEKGSCGGYDSAERIAAAEKWSDLEHELSQEEINLEKLRRFAFTGLPNGGGIRATAWKLLLDYLPPSQDLWDKELSGNREKYAKLKEELLLTPVSDVECRQSELWREKDEALNDEADVAGQLQRHRIEDHPLNDVKASVWHQYFQKHGEIAEQIDRDVDRTHPDLNFFSGDSSFSRKNRGAMRDILLLFAKVNPAIGYVQGMNEVLAPIFHVFSTTYDEQDLANVEADSFYCFVRLMSDSIDHFCKHMDNSPVGILSTLSRLMELLKANDEELWCHLVYTSKVNPQFYAFRWITLLLTQEFKFQSILRIWDSLLSSPFGIQDMLLRICCAMLVSLRSKLLGGDFAANLKLLQHFPDEIGIEYLLRVSRDIGPDGSALHFDM
ncbi:unnamed protein product [Linum tenue]|uniref:Rab-GAP TBC domain-containing protein n=1 Tax=Linum tenue TaxID=586396 RepID=A0AAV0QBE9_9ROSI|nr:unnamed protein product [Linum tenue]